MSNATETSISASSARHYLRVFIGLTALLVTSVFTLNLAVDPLWKLGGNRLTGINYGFDERRGKLHQLLRDPEGYDCLIFGSSKTTLLDADWFTAHRCFNLAFSFGLIGEFTAFADYVKSRGIVPDRVILGVDAFNFEQAVPLVTVPDFVLNNEEPPGLLRDYVSLDAFDFSRRTLAGQSPLKRYYEADFSPQILPGLPPFDPSTSAITVWPDLRPENVSWYQAFAERFPNADFVVYIPPLSVYELASIADQGQLRPYAEAMYALTGIFDEVYDFAIPSSVTARLDNTYDGAHYDLATNERVALAMAAGEPDFGVLVNALSREAYFELLSSGLREYRDRLDIGWRGP